MGKGSKTKTTTNERSTSTTTGLEAAQPALQSLLDQVSGRIGTAGLSPVENAALSGLAATAGTGTEFTPQVRGLISDLFQGGGFGAGLGNDGAVQCASPLDNCTNTPIEAGELAFGFMRIRRYELDPDSQGFGRNCGALGAVREYEILRDGVQFASFSDRHRHAPSGLFGGRSARPTRFVLLRNGEERVLPSKGSVPLQSGDRLQVRVGGGGGYGDPRERDPALVRNDLQEERISSATARDVFGFNNSTKA